MPRGRGRGGKRGKRKGGFGGKRELVYKEDGQEYGQIQKLLGSGRMSCMCFDGVERLVKVRGKFKRRVWVNVNDIVLVNVREFEESKGDIVHVYYYDEAKQLKQQGELPKDLKIEKSKTNDEGDLDIQFEEDEAEVKKKTVKKEKQNLDDFMPNSSSEDEDEEEIIKEEKELKTDQTKPETKKVTQIKEESSEEEKDSDTESEEEPDELADI